MDKVTEAFSEWLSTKEAALHLGVTSRRVTQLIQKGKLLAQLVGQRGRTYSRYLGGRPGKPVPCRGTVEWRIHMASVESLIHERTMQDLERAAIGLARAEKKREFFKLKKMGRRNKYDNQLEV